MTAQNVGPALFRDYPQFKPIEASLYRQIRHIVTKALCDFWVSAASYFGVVAVGSILDTPGASQLQRTRCLGQSAMVEYGAVWNKDRPWLHFAQAGMFDDVELPNLDIATNKIAIPFILKGCLRDHIVAIYIDRAANRIEYYDSKGLTVRDRNDPKLNRILQQALQKYGNANTTLVENTEKHQYDSHNCGVYVLDYFFRRISETAEKIFANGYGPCAANGPIRARMITQLQPAAAH